MSDQLASKTRQSEPGLARRASTPAPLSETLTPSRPSRSDVQPVSRVWFELSDKDAFDQCVKQAVHWMAQTPKGSTRPRSGVALPEHAWGGEPFDVTDELGANPAKALRLDASDGELWAARLDWPDPSCPRSWLSEFFVEKRVGRMARFGAQLTCVRRGECPPFDPSRPSVVKRVLETLSAEADGHPLADRIEPMNRADAAQLVDLLYNDTRRLPVVVISEEENGQMGLIPDAAAHRIAGAAHIVRLTHDGAWELTRLLGRRMSVFNGAVRLYQPGLTEVDEDPFAHPLWLRGAQGDGATLRQIASRVLPAAFLDRSEAFPRYAAVREAINRQALLVRSSEKADPAQEELELAQSMIAEYAEERDEWRSLAQEEQDRRLETEKEVERLKAELVQLEAKASMLEFSLGQRQDAGPEAPAPSRPLQSYDDLENWAEEVLGDGVYIHQAALKDCRKNGHENMLPRIEAALLVMRDHMTPARRTGGADHREQAREKLGALGIEDTACFVNRDEARRRPQYAVSYGGETRVLFDHLKHGNGYNNANQIRIYYFWDDEKKRHVVGKMPSHLPNNLTN